MLITIAMPTPPPSEVKRACRGASHRLILPGDSIAHSDVNDDRMHLHRNAAAFDAASHPDPQADAAPQWLLQQKGAAQLAALSGAAEAISAWWAARQGREPSGSAGLPDAADVRYCGETCCWLPTCFAWICLPT